MQQVESLVDLVELHVVRDVFVQLGFSLHVHVYQLRHLWGHMGNVDLAEVGSFRCDSTVGKDVRV